MTKDNDIDITSVFRIPVGSFKGSLSELKTIALDHPIGASAARIPVTLLREMQKKI